MRRLILKRLDFLLKRKALPLSNARTRFALRNESTKRRNAIGWIAAAAMTLGAPAMAAGGERVQITGEAIDTWCYFSGVMGGPDAVVGSAHHTCALWCSAGGIPVGLLGEDGQVYMVLKIAGDATSNGGDTQMSIASHTITADGMLYKRDGINYLVVAEVVADQDIINQTHEDFGVVPGFAIPDPVE